MTKQICSLCSKEYNFYGEYDLDYDSIYECPRCLKKLNWFAYGVLVGIIFMALVYYLFIWAI